MPEEKKEGGGGEEMRGVCERGEVEGGESGVEGSEGVGGRRWFRLPKVRESPTQLTTIV